MAVIMLNRNSGAAEALHAPLLGLKACSFNADRFSDAFSAAAEPIKACSGADALEVAPIRPLFTPTERPLARVGTGATVLLAPSLLLGPRPRLLDACEAEEARFSF
jgi:hypothetical protein